jgi:phage-related tail fiber protein
VLADGTNGTVDLRGEFIRGWDNGRGVDAGRGLGTFQDYAMNNIQGNARVVVDSYGSYKPTGANNAFTFSAYYGGTSTTSGADSIVNLNFSTAKAIGVDHVANEIRPRNIALLPCMKQ